MTGVLKFFGVAAFIGGVLAAAVLLLGAPIPDGRGGTWNVAYAAALGLGGLFWMALCVTVAEISEKLDRVIEAREAPAAPERPSGVPAPLRSAPRP